MSGPRWYTEPPDDVRCVCGAVAEVVHGRVVEHSTPSGSPCDVAIGGAVRGELQTRRGAEREPSPCRVCGLWYCEHGVRR